MTFARDLAPVNTSAFNKLTRTFAMQMEALKHYRSGAGQKVTLQHVSVAEGGQAIVGNVTQVPRNNGREKATQEKAAMPRRGAPNRGRSQLSMQRLEEGSNASECGVDARGRP